MSQLKTVVVTDCGSTTTKAVMFERTDAGWRQTFRGEAPTTVEQPIADVTVGVINALTELGELSGRTLVSDEKKIIKGGGKQTSLDLYLSTSSAGGGLQMVVAGIVRELSGRSAERAALSAGAIVLDIVSLDDDRDEYEIVTRIRNLKPDIVLLAGGFEKSGQQLPSELALLFKQAAPKPRFGETIKLPIIYAGSKDAFQEIERLLQSEAQLMEVDNLRPAFGVEDLKGAREAIHEFFLSHVMSHAPGYGRLVTWADRPVMPTPAAFGIMVENFAKKKGIQLLAVDIGGATTDVFSYCYPEKNSAREGDGRFTRTVSANLGMSYSVGNVLLEAGAANVRRWLREEISLDEVSDRLRNKMLRPTSIPQTIDDLLLEQAVCREALRLSLRHHMQLAVAVADGVEMGIGSLFAAAPRQLLRLKEIDLVIGSGGVLSHAPDRVAAGLMMLDGFELEGVTELAVDSIFMMPHLGVFSTVDPVAAAEILERDCLIHIGISIVPLFEGITAGEELAEIFLGDTKVGVVVAGKLEIKHLNVRGNQELTIKPKSRKIDVGVGSGETYSKILKTEDTAIFLDGRGRPIFGDSVCR